jgi:hypothetical protein
MGRKLIIFERFSTPLLYRLLGMESGLADYNDTVGGCLMDVRWMFDGCLDVGWMFGCWVDV